MIRPVEKIDDLVPVKNVVISVSDKKNLDILINGLLKHCPGANIYSTGGTYDVLRSIMTSQEAEHLFEVSQYTGQPETEGGLVKTLHHKLFLGYLTETYCEAHQQDLEREKAVPIDLAVINLYRFQEVIAKPKTSFESARGNIDVGGPSALRAVAKNFLRVMPCIDPGDYQNLVEELALLQGCTCIHSRFAAAGKVFRTLSNYDGTIAEYFASADMEQVIDNYQVFN